MPHNTDRILTTHVGSLIRPPKLIDFWRLIEEGKPYDQVAFEACLTECVTEVVRQQADVGIDMVSDGEFSKGVNWAFYIFKRLSGIIVRPATPEELQDPMASMSGGQDRKAFPEFYAEYDAATGLGKRLGYRVVVNAPISYSSRQRVGRDIENIIASLSRAKDQYPTLAGFLPVVAPASALPGAKITPPKPIAATPLTARGFTPTLNAPARGAAELARAACRYSQAASFDWTRKRRRAIRRCNKDRR
jgi:5-methyltetrahydropteroyltriglutamate--homocysteine methyltransferase